MYLLLSTDLWHTRKSEKLLAICETKEKAIELAIKHSEKDGLKMTSEDILNLKNIGQTQGYSKELEYILLEQKVNKLIE